jgi:hypothetical protein
MGNSHQDYFPRDTSHDQSSKLFKQNQQLDFYVQNSNFICIKFYIENIYWGIIAARLRQFRLTLEVLWYYRLVIYLAALRYTCSSWAMFSLVHGSHTEQAYSSDGWTRDLYACSLTSGETDVNISIQRNPSVLFIRCCPCLCVVLSWLSLLFTLVFISSSVLCIRCCQCLCVVHSWLSLLFTLVFILSCKGQSRMNNTETLTTSDTQDTGKNKH